MDLSSLLKFSQNVLWIVFLAILWNQRLSSIFGSIALAFILAELVTLYIKTKSTSKLLDNLSSRAVFVTGCDTGIGHHLVKQLDSLGVTVYAGCLHAEGQGAADLKRQCSANLKTVQLDVTNEENIASAVKYVKSTLQEKKLWAIVNNAAINFTSPIEMCPMNVAKKIIDVNTVGTIAVTKAFLPLLRLSKGRVVIVSSPLGRFPIPLGSFYSLSKAAVTSFCESLRDELRVVGVSVHMVEPYTYETPLNSSLSNEICLQEVWDKCPKEIKEFYGDKYLKYMKKVVIMVGQYRKSILELNEVTDEIVAASLSCDPEMNHVTGGFTERLLIKFITTIPVGVQRIIKNPEGNFYLRNLLYLFQKIM